MAVQAQYPSNLLFLNRNVQEEKPQLGGDYAYNQQIDQAHIMISNGVEANSRKRSREIATSSLLPINAFSLQPHPSQFVDLRLAFSEQQQLHLQQSHSSQSSVLYSVLSDDLTPQIRHQRDEIEQFLHAQGEQLRRALAEKRQRHYHALLSAAEESVSHRLREKEAESARAAQLNAELESHAARLRAESRAWQARAKAGEAAAAALQAQLQQALARGACADDAESVCEDPDRVVAVAGPACGACSRRPATVVVLPCRHLSLCDGCNRDTCPACFSVKESSVEVNFSGSGPAHISINL